MATNPASPQARRSRRRRIAVWSLVTILAGALLLPLGGYVYVNAVQAAPAQAPAGSAAEQQTNPRANYWRAVRDGFEGYTAASGPYTTNVLIANGGQNWRQLRNGPVASLLPWLMALMVLGLGVYYILHGPVKVSAPLSGKTVERFTYNERVLHWYTAVLFILLAITGLSLMLGDPVDGSQGLRGLCQYSCRGSQLSRAAVYRRGRAGDFDVGAYRNPEQG